MIQWLLSMFDTKTTKYTKTHKGTLLAITEPATNKG